MGIVFILLLGVALSLDSLAVSLSLGFTLDRTTRRERVRFLILIGIFHLAMIVLGWGTGERVSGLISSYDHWVSFVLLSFMGGKMIYEGAKKNEGEKQSQMLCLPNTLMLCLALSIDAFIAGFSLGLVRVLLIDASQLCNILLAGTIIGLCASAISTIGIFIGSRASARLGSKAEVIGGIILILIGLEILIGHLTETVC